MTRVLIVESDQSLAALYKETIEALHSWVVVVPTLEAATDLLRRQFFHVCLWPVGSANEIGALFQAKQDRPSTAFIALCEGSASKVVVAAMRAGASHFFDKSACADTLREILEDTFTRIVPDPIDETAVIFPIPDFVGRHPKILEIFQLIMSIKNSDSTVLITGESGTGKEIVARAIHSISPRHRSPWVAINCGAIPVNLLESELFGHMKGAFTGATQNRPGRFQLAKDGTLFLDEISDLPLDLQAKLLRAIQHRVYEPVGSVHSLKLEARIIAATNQDLETAVAEKRFREDLFYRLNVIPVFIPPLRGRKSDIPLLVKNFIDKFNRTTHRSIPGIGEEAMRCLTQYHWPGNIRELENLIERVVLLKKRDDVIELKDFPIDYFRNVRLDRFVANVALPEEGLDFNDAVNEFENELILQALQRTAGNKNKAASLLNLNRTTLVEKLKRKGLRIAG